MLLPALHDCVRAAVRSRALHSLPSIAAPNTYASASGRSRPQVQLILEDGAVFDGFAFGAQRPIAGEVVFNTGMSSYPESLTDPSYRGQILSFTYPLIGNYGAPGYKLDELGLQRYLESSNIHVSGVVVSDYSEEHSHFEAVQSLSDWMAKEDIPGITGVDTRALTKRIREHGAMLGKIVPKDAGFLTDFADPNKRNLVADVSRKSVETFVQPGGGDIDILAVDCGMKENIIRHLVKRGARVRVVPWDYDFTQEQYDGLFLSNGPGDPTMCTPTIQHLKHALQQHKPVFGICLGHQLMALASGAETYKLRFGNRGQNQPCVNLEDRRCYITSQNHGYAVDAATLAQDWEPLFVNANDGSNEGMKHKHRPFFSVQFHPEAAGGPQDTEFLFDRFLTEVRLKKAKEPELFLPIGPALASGKSISSAISISSNSMRFPAAPLVPSYPPLRKVLILGSGGLQIGQAGEFDYSGSQAIKALQEHNIKSVLVNPNIATVQTAEGLADQVYLLPVEPEFVQEIIAKERPDGIFLQFGGQTALNCGVELSKRGILSQYGVRVLGTSVESIVATEDRDIFAQKLMGIGESIATSVAATSTDAAIQAARDIGYPVIVRAAFSLGGLGSGFAHDEEQLRTLCSRAFSQCPQVLVEKSLKGWKEIEYEVVRDEYDNCVTVCNMENFDPLGIHTGDSIVVAPSQTLSDQDYHMLRSASIRVARRLGIVGECNVQFALDPNSRDYCIIEANPRLSRSSALASKATGYPLAFVAAKLALGENLIDVKNSITGSTTACFEPSLDYVVTKIPRWDIKKFNNASPVLGSGMKSVGEVMAIGRTFEESLQKAVRMVDPSLKGFEPQPTEDLVDALTVATESRLYAVAEAFRQGYSVDQIHGMTQIDRWFLFKCKAIHDLGCEMQTYTLETVPATLVADAKRAGFSDQQMADRLGCKELELRYKRKEMGVVPVVKQIDTLAAEFPAKTNYLYTTYSGTEDDVSFGSGQGSDDAAPSTMVLGSGVYRIGSSVEFDYSAVQCVRTLRQIGHKTIMVNYNPETVSTDYDESDRLYFEELSLERVLDIHDKEAPQGTVVSVGGQIPNNLSLPLHNEGVRIVGTHPHKIDNAEDRHKFSSLMDEAGIDQPAWRELSSFEDAQAFCEQVGFPVLVRPSYVLSGAAMNVVRTQEQLQRYLKEAADVSKDYPVVISKFIEDAREIELDAVAQDGELVVHAIAEHVEQAGVHSGDATLVLPPQKMTDTEYNGVLEAGRTIARVLEISGPFNCQFLLTKDGAIKVIETNLRASRSLPFCAKVLGVDFAEKAARIFAGERVTPVDIDMESIPYVGVKAPQFSWGRLLGADPVLGVEMASTGEVGCLGDTKEEAFLTALIATNLPLPRGTILIMAGDYKDDFLPSARALAAMGYKLLATPPTALHLARNGVAVTRANMPRQDDYLADPHTLDVLHALRNKEADLFFNFPLATSLGQEPNTDEQRKTHRIRRAAVDHNVPIITNLKVAQQLVEALAKMHRFKIQSYQEHRSMARAQEAGEAAAKEDGDEGVVVDLADDVETETAESETNVQH